MVRAILSGRVGDHGPAGTTWASIFGRSSSDDSSARKISLFASNGKRKLRERSATLKSDGSETDGSVATRLPSRLDEGLGVGLALQEYMQASSGTRGPRSVVDRDIMHREVNADLMVYIVKKNASSEDIGQAFDVAPQYVHSRWHAEDERPSGKRGTAVQRHGYLSKPCDPSALEVALRMTLRRLCGFSQAKSHPDMSIAGSSRLVTRPTDGFYRTAFSSRALPANKPCYFEMSIMDMERGSGALCGIVVGSPSRHASRVVGSSGESVGLFTSGHVVQNTNWTAVTSACAEGDVIGCLVSPRQSGSAMELLVYFFVNCKLVARTPVSLAARAGEPVHAAVSMRQSDVTVMLRCCPDELVVPRCVPPDTHSVCGLPLSGGADSVTWSG